MATAQTAVHASATYKVYAAVVADLDLFTERPGAGLQRIDVPARGFIAGGAGTLILTDMSGTVSTVAAAANILYPLQAKTIGAASTATNILVMW